ncbi:hypothetical protein I4U23_019120 [Adineta vaga]|nr:hypothetical protein I4U23_019120 [Adineta vaga]
MSRSTFLTTTSSFESSETPSLSTTTNNNTDHTRALRYHHRLMPTISSSSRSNESLPVLLVQSSSTTDSTTKITTNTTQHKSVVRLNPKGKRNTRDKRRATGIRPDDVLSANVLNDSSFNNEEEEDNTIPHNQFITITSVEPNESHDRNRTSSPKPVFTVSRVQPTYDDNSRHTFDKLTISRTDPYTITSTPSATIFQPTEFIVRRQPSADDSSMLKCRQLEERIRTLESLMYDKDSIIHDLQRKLDNTTRDLNDAEQQIYILQRDKLTLIKALTSLETNSSGGTTDHSASTVRTDGFGNDDLCRLIELNIPQSLSSYHFNDIEEKLFYKTDSICQNKPVFRSMKYSNLYQFQSPTNRWWSLYDTTNSTYKLGMREWCDAWNMKPLLSMSLGMFQHPLGKSKRGQRWQYVIVHERNNSYTYKSMSNVHLKCYDPPSLPSPCQTRQLTFLFDLTELTTDNEFHQMKLLTKSLIWLLYNQTQIALSYYRDTFHLIHSFDNQTSSKSLEHLFDSVDAINKQLETPKRFAVRWAEAIHNVATKIFKRRLLLPINIINSTDQYQSSTNDTIDDEVYTEPYPLIYSDDLAILTILNITTKPYREKRSIKTKYDRRNHVLVILTSRSKDLYDYKERDRRLAQFVASVPLRIVVIDFNKISNKKTAEYMHSAFVHNAKYALVSQPLTYNYIETYEELGDAVHGNQLFDHYHRLCQTIDESLFNQNFTTTIMETNVLSTVECSLLTLSDNQDLSSTLKEKFDYTFYQTTDRCFYAPVYRSLADRNLYAQRISNGRWVIIRVDPLLPSIMTIERRLALTTTSTLPPEFIDGVDYVSDPMIDDNYLINNRTLSTDIQISVPHCSNTPGLDILWESEDSYNMNDYSLRSPRQWISNTNQSDLIPPICNKYKISCHTTRYDLLLLIDSQYQYITSIQTFLEIFLALIEPFSHRFSLMVLSSTTVDPFQYHSPLTAINVINNKILENFLLYTDHENSSMVQLNQHMQRASEYLMNNQQVLSTTHTQQIILTISSRLNFNEYEMKNLIQRYSSIRYMALDPYLKTDDDFINEQKREKLITALTSSPSYGNVFRSYEANRDLTFNTVFRLLESLCGYLR